MGTGVEAALATVRTRITEAAERVGRDPLADDWKLPEHGLLDRPLGTRVAL